MTLDGIPTHGGRPLPWIQILLLAVFLWGGEYVRRGLWEPDEVRYAYVTREMAADGHWFVLQRYDTPYLHKPPLLFWMIQASSFFTGGEVTPVSARLPSLLGAFLSLWATSRLAFLWAGRGASRTSVLILMTSYLFWRVNGMGQTDALLCGLQMTGLYLLFLADHLNRLWPRMAAYAAMGLATLTKGPVGVLVPLGAYVAARLAARQAGTVRWNHLAWGIPLVLLFPATWLGLAWWTGVPDGFFHELLLDQNAGRYAGSMGIGHRRGVLYFLLHFPLELLPWTFLFIPAVRFSLSPAARPEHRALLGWILFILLFFSFSATKRNLYVLMAYPAAALLIATTWDAMQKQRPQAVRVAAWITVGLMVLSGASALGSLLFHQVLPVPGRALVPTGVVLLVGATWLTRITRREGPLSDLWLKTCGGVLLGALALLGTLGLPALNPLKTPVSLVQAAAATDPRHTQLVLYRMQDETYAYHTRLPTRRVDTPSDLSAAMQNRTGFVVMQDRLWDEVRTVFEPGTEPTRFDLGNKHMLWVRFGKPGP
jgi:4-amino-4-deoxy-L-arabinose transferase